MKLLVVIDMQNDFIDGALGTKEAEAIVENVAGKMKAYRDGGNPVVFTRDTHGEDYLQTQEGKFLPVIHCVKGSSGWQITEKLDVKDSPVFDKPSFGSLELAEYVKRLAGENHLEEIELVGLCTDICVISNAMLLKAAVPEIPVSADSSCCAGVTPASHENALSAMKMCQIIVK